MWPNDPPAGWRPTSGDSVEKHPLHTMTWRNNQIPRAGGIPSAFRFSPAATHKTRSPASFFSLAGDMPFKMQVLYTCGLVCRSRKHTLRQVGRIVHPVCNSGIAERKQYYRQSHSYSCRMDCSRRDDSRGLKASARSCTYCSRQVLKFLKPDMLTRSNPGP